MLERKYQAELIKKLRILFVGCVIVKNDSSYLQGIPDLLILWHDRWGMLEVKMDVDSPCQPNQEYYIDILDQMSFAAFICPENEEEVLNALQSAFAARRKTRRSQRE